MNKTENNIEELDVLMLLRDKTNKWLPVNAAAKEVKLSLSTVYRLIEKKQIKAIRVGKRNTLVLESSLREYLKSLNP